MGILNPLKKELDKKVGHFQSVHSQNLLIIFTRNPELGKCKTRLAKTVGDQTALEIYTFLLEHTAKITQNLAVDKTVYYSSEIWKEDIWDNSVYCKKLQRGGDLGERMAHAFSEEFASGYQRIVIIGSDMFDLSEKDIKDAFVALDESDFVIGPAQDGGYYLLGMKEFMSDIFQNKDWGTESVLKDTLAHLEHKKVTFLDTKNDIDVFEDIKDIATFEPFLKDL